MRKEEIEWPRPSLFSLLLSAPPCSSLLLPAPPLLLLTLLY